jgi:4'-phosphopantetheinyl transferase
VDLWCFYGGGVCDETLRREHEALLSPDERAKGARFRFESDRLLHLATRALVRTVLSEYADVAPSDWRFAPGEHGKPYVVGPPGAPQMSFNLTNTRGLVVCAVSLSHPRIGVDAEWLERGGETLSLAQESLSQVEIQELSSLAPGEQRERFFSYWTLKESYIKARGVGLALPLDAFSFLLDDPSKIRIVFTPGCDDTPDGWRFALLSDSSRHLVAVAVDTGGAELTLRATSYVPLRGARPFAWEASP